MVPENVERDPFPAPPPKTLPQNLREFLLHWQAFFLSAAQSSGGERVLVYPAEVANVFTDCLKLYEFEKVKQEAKDA